MGIFDYFKHHHDIKASEIVSIMDYFPELALQNRQDMMSRKFKLISKSHGGLTDIYLRNLFKRHPDMFLKSYGSMEAKINYLRR